MPTVAPLASARHGPGLRSLGARAAIGSSLALALVACGGGNRTDTGTDTSPDARAELNADGTLPARLGVLENGRTALAPIDRGTGAPPVASTRSAKRAAAAAQGRATALASAVAAATTPQTGGRFLAPIAWPVIPIHASLLPDGRVMSYGSDEQGLQGSQHSYEVWDPSLGTGPEAHLLLANTTGTDIFCGGQIVLPRTGEVIIAGGDRTIGGVRNYSTADVNFFDYLTGALRKSSATLAQPRWYPTVTTLADGSVLVLGGRDKPNETSVISTPELYSPDTGWRSLTGATSDAAYGAGTNAWYYPRAWIAPDARVFVAAHSGQTFLMSPQGSGSIAQQALTLPTSDYWLPSVMFAPGRILSVRQGAQVSVIDLNGTAPTASITAALSQERLWSNATVLADGKVLVSGGSGVENQAVDVAYQTELWDPATGAWTIGASATRMRLYHSTALLLPDGRVLTAGGGAPGPVSNLNAEIYEPPYLFKSDGSGDYATRPVIAAAPARAAWGDTFSVQMQSDASVSRVAFIKTGSVTHSFDFDQRYMTLAFAQSGANLSVQAPPDAATAPPGTYLLFAFDANGVPSVAKIVRLVAASDPPLNALTVRAHASLAGNVGAMMDVRINGTLLASTEVRSTTDQDYTFPLPGVTPGGANVEVVFTNAAIVAGTTRSLHVSSISINRATIVPTDASVSFDRGSGYQAFDHLDVLPGTTDLDTNGALRFAAPGAQSTTLTVRVRADIAENVGPVMQVRINGVLAASQEIRDTAYTDHVLRVPYALPPGTALDVVFVNDGSATGDRNLYVESVTVNGSTLRPTDPGVTIDIGSGAAAFDGAAVIPGQSAILWNAALRFTVPTPGPQIVVRARASLAGGVGPLMHLLVDGAEVGAVEVRSTDYQDVYFPLGAAVNPGARLDVVFSNDAMIGGEDRNLYVASLTVNGATLAPTDPGVTIDLGSGSAAFDGVTVIAGQTDILWNAALRFVAPDSTAPKLVVRAKGSLAGGVGPDLRVLVNGTSIGAVLVQSTSDADYVFTLPAALVSGDQIDVVFDNDAFINGEDRNLYVQSVTAGGLTLLPTDPGATIDIGNGAAAFDGLIVIPGQTDILWNAALRLTLP